MTSFIYRYHHKSVSFPPLPISISNKMESDATFGEFSDTEVASIDTKSSEGCFKIPWDNIYSYLNVNVVLEQIILRKIPWEKLPYWVFVAKCTLVYVTCEETNSPPLPLSSSVSLFFCISPMMRWVTSITRSRASIIDKTKKSRNHVTCWSWRWRCLGKWWRIISPLAI